jgi:hypothetical protein
MSGDPVTEGGGTLNCNALFSFKLHAVHLGTNIVFATDLVTGEKQIKRALERLPHEWP